MDFFNIPKIGADSLAPQVRENLRCIGDQLTKPVWTIRPLKLEDHLLDSIQPFLKSLPIQPRYSAVIMIPAKTVCKTHTDNIGGRKTAINIPLQVDHQKSFFEYMQGDTVTSRLSLETTKCLRVDIPHRVDNSLNSQNRVVLSLSYDQSPKELFGYFCEAGLLEALKSHPLS